LPEDRHVLAAQHLDALRVVDAVAGKPEGALLAAVVGDDR
jgi:hypothetical protein